VIEFVLRKVALGALGLSFVGQAEANDTPFRGVGFFTCAEYSVWEAKGLATSDVVSWVYGYWSAFNRALAQTGRPMKNIMDSTANPEPLSAQLIAICKNEPSLLIVFAADRIFERLPVSIEGEP
jgi:hypothetical protein